MNKPIPRLNPHRYNPRPGQLIYHYCTPETFLEICKNKTLRFSGLAAMNDSNEFKFGLSQLDEAMRLWLAKNSGANQKHFIDTFASTIKLVSSSEIKFLISCYSLKGDVLSQWRAYSSNGLGFAIGFRPSKLIDTNTSASRVVYSEAQQLKVLDSLITEGYECLIENNGKDMNYVQARTTFAILSYKHPAFAEEFEIRLSRLLTVEKGKLIDQSKTPPDFTIRASIPVPYQDTSFTIDGRWPAISEVIVGPRNQSSDGDIKDMLETFGHRHVTIKRSQASYR